MGGAHGELSLRQKLLSPRVNPTEGPKPSKAVRKKLFKKNKKAE